MSQPMRVSGIFVNLCFTVVLPLVAVNVLQAHGVDVVRALAISSIFPAFETAMSWLRSRRLDALGAISLGFIAIGILASLVSGDVHFALAKESVFTGVFGLMYLGSLLAPRPLMFYVSRTFAGGGDRASQDAWSARWAYPRFREVMREMSLVWGVTFVAEAALRIVLVYVLPVNAVIVGSPLLATAVIALLMVWTIRYGKSAEQRALQQRAAAESAAQIAPA